MFKNRTEAGKLLSQALKVHAGEKTVILALPRGGVVVGYEVAKALKSPLDIVVTRKIGHPSNPEYAICAVDENGLLLCDEESESVDREWLHEEILRQQEEAKRRVALYRGNLKPVEIKNKLAIIVDDGIATGLTMRLAVDAVRARHPSRIIIAVPIASSEAIRELRAKVDECVLLEPPENFSGSVGAHYEIFGQVSDAEVIRLLHS